MILPKSRSKVRRTPQPRPVARPLMGVSRTSIAASPTDRKTVHERTTNLPRARRRRIDELPSSPASGQKRPAHTAEGGKLPKHAPPIEEEWPEGSAQCEGCQRVTYGCEAYGSSSALLCPSCTKMKSPAMWALARECMNLQAGVFTSEGIGLEVH